MNRLVALLVAFSLVPNIAEGRPRQRGVGRHGKWQQPACTSIAGLRSVRFVHEETIANVTLDNPRASDIVPSTGVTALAASPIPNLLYAIFELGLYESRDSGCTWSKRAELPNLGYSPELETTHPSHVYAYSQEQLTSITAEGITTFALPERIRRIGADRADALHLRAIAVYGATYESHDGGATWQRLGDATEWSVNDAAIDPADFEHILVMATDHYPIRASYDGGRTWSPTGMARAYGWSLAFSPSDSRVVWAAAWEGGGGTTPVEGIYRSLDGGVTWQRVVTESHNLEFSRVTFAPHPAKPGAVAFTTNDGVAVFDGELRIAVQTFGRPITVAWSPAGTIYFSEWVNALTSD